MALYSDNQPRLKLVACLDMILPCNPPPVLDAAAQARAVANHRAIAQGGGRGRAGVSAEIRSLTAHSLGKSQVRSGPGADASQKCKNPDTVRTPAVPHTGAYRAKGLLTDPWGGGGVHFLGTR